jgi:transcription elongation factor
MDLDTEAAASATRGMAAGAQDLSAAAAGLRSALSAIGSPGYEGSELTGALEEFTALLMGSGDHWAVLRGTVAEGMNQSVTTARAADGAATRVLNGGDGAVAV